MSASTAAVIMAIAMRCFLFTYLEAVSVSSSASAATVRFSANVAVFGVCKEDEAEEQARQQVGLGHSALVFCNRFGDVPHLAQ